MKRNSGWLLAPAMIAMVIVTGCQATPQAVRSENPDIMSLWITYQRCQNGIDVDAIRHDAERLTRLAHAPPDPDADLPLPQIIRQWVSEPANRLAVDPKAMAAACSLRVGLLALSHGHPDLAADMFRSVLAYPERAYPYYVSQARAGLAMLGVDRKPADTPEIVSAPIVRFVAAH